MTIRKRQRGAALLTAMIIVTLVVTLASQMVWQQWRAVQVETAERARLQSAWILSGALAWAQLILREDGKSGRPTALTEPWATPLAEARLSTFLAVDKDNTGDDGPEAFLSGSIVDAQSRYNLRNLVDDNKVVEAELEGLRQLFETINVSPGVAERIATGLLQALAPAQTGAGGGSVPLPPESVAQLAWFGIDSESIQLMSPYVVILPARAQVNLNTAPREVMLAAITGLDVGTAERLIQVRQRTPFKTLPEVRTHLPEGLDVDDKRVTLKSDYFEIRGRLRLEDRVLEEISLVHRSRGNDIVPLTRRRENARGS
ncbi:type II secretion system minor pseudopilin GspK [Piscinibacter sp.]|uniref:type II secretion system minor pseudopilin GspK n=1 Tax=Piscinibacter sp. TaxID=1903157 RepID=UPI002CB1102D|nr:type II secretion system minor pseudopilin GspK [Albitalea sp.]HUG26424.1 type II secretion system minor pseudopilin GspK [Albitalea sp.]